MKLSNEVLINSINVLSKLNNMELNIKVSYAIAKNIDKLEKELKVYNDQKKKLIEKYSVKGEAGNVKVNEDGTINIQEDKVQDWNKDINELITLENEVDIHQINVEDLFKCDCNITPVELNLINYMIEE
ncbi:hypothetical protein [Clostridium cadaveris]|uniref:hypothetical protein n=1 Tax=Clostridium cadaveris TaxID=1529 RepID=UPI0015B6E133|nr:hypothetical protein [Clostridium cadaveris]NWK12777.1 hypothetical protein [Clostridium cadaveris]